MKLLETLGEAIAPNNLAKIQVKIINKNNEIGDLQQKLEIAKNELANFELLEIYANQRDCQNHLIDNVLRVNCQESLGDIKIELGYDTILKDWNIERERANLDANATKLIELRKNQTQLLKDLASIDAQIFELELSTINA